MALEKTNYWCKVDKNGSPEIIGNPSSRPRSYGVNTPDDRLAQDGWYPYWEDDQESPGEFYSSVQGDLIFDDPNARVTRTNTWEKWSVDIIRQNHKDNINGQRQSSNQTQIDVRADPGLVGLMDEVNTAAIEHDRLLGETSDEEVENFNPDLPTEGLSSVAHATSLNSQIAQVVTDPTLTGDQINELDALSTIYDDIIVAGDTDADVPPPPSYVRAKIGIFGEEYGILEAFRTQSGEFWNLSFKLRIDRELNPADYWLAIYSGDSPDDINDDTGYLTTPQLTKISDGLYEADESSVNLPRPTTDDVFKFTLCHGHITNKMFDKMTLDAGDTHVSHRARWGGDASEVWQDSGQDVTGIVGGATYNVADTTPFEGLAASTPIRLGGEGEPETTFTRVHQAGQPGIIVVGDHDAAAVGKRIWHK